jgi:TolA-binding protein
VGPFLVTVKGTVFTVSWDAATERFELRLQHGQVSVTGPIAGGEIPVRAGQRLVVNLPREEITITEQKPEEVWPGLPTAATALPSADASTDAQPSNGSAGQGALESSLPVVGRTSGKRAWTDAAASGDWDRILADVDRTGAKRSLAEASSEELFVLADAARYRGRTALAREALQAERTRFPGSTRALDAVFLLGRLEESSQGGTRRAIAWYEEYLTRAPLGTYASEALGRRMIAMSRLEGAARAKPVAEEYLLRFPRGTYAGAARALLQAP